MEFIVPTDDGPMRPERCRI